MTRTEDRLADALAAAARAVPEESLRPLVAPERRDHRHRPGWLAPVAAALGVILVIGLAVLASRLTSGTAGPPVGLPPGVPRYYVQTSLTTARPVVRATSTGAVTSTIPVPAAASPPGYPIAAVDANGTYFVAAYSPANRGERLYRFRLTPAGRVTGFSALPGGKLAGVAWAADALAISPDGSQIAVGLAFSPPGPCGGPGRRACPFPRSDYLMVINAATGARTIWRNEVGAPSPWFSVESLSWTTRGELVFLGQWCQRSGYPPEQCGSSLRTAEIRALNPASGGGWVTSGRLLLRRTAPEPYPVQAVISPDGATITAVMVQGKLVEHGQIRDIVPQDMYVLQMSAADGRPLTVLYHRRLGNTTEVNDVPDFLALGQDPPGQHFLLDIGLCTGNCTDGANGWIHDGRLVPLTPVNGREADQAW